MEAQISTARNEDTWDRILYEQLGLPNDLREDSWVSGVQRALREIHDKQDLAIQKRKSIAERMHEIVEKERILALEEKMAIRDAKYKAKKARRLLRKTKQQGTNSEQLLVDRFYADGTEYPEDIISHPSPPSITFNRSVESGRGI